MEASGRPPTDRAVLLDAAEHLDRAAKKLGLTCSACGCFLPERQREAPSADRDARIPSAAMGVEFVTLVPALRGGQAGVEAEHDVICVHPDCADAREHLWETATAARIIRNAWTPIIPEPESNGDAPEAAGLDVYTGPERDLPGHG